MKSNKRMIAWILSVMLIVAMAFTTVGCNGKNQSDVNPSSTEAQSVEEIKTEIASEGKTMFFFTVVDKNGKEVNFEIHTDKETVGEALMELELIEGEQGDYGLYVKTVNGITADYDVDQTYWAFYVNGEYATAGVDVTPVEEGASYSFKVEK